MYIHTNTHGHTYAYTYTYNATCTYTYIYTNIYTCVSAYVLHTYINHTCIQTNVFCTHDEPLPSDPSNLRQVELCRRKERHRASDPSFPQILKVKVTFQLLLC